MPLTIPPVVDVNQLTSGEAVVDRLRGAHDTIGAVGTGTLLLTYFTAQKTEVISQVRMYTSSTPAAATPTLCRIGVWSANAAGDLGALLASTPNDTTLFAAANTAYLKSFSASFTKAIGTRYACGVLVVSGAAMPQYIGWSTVAAATSKLEDSPRVCATIGAQSDLPSTATAASMTATTRVTQFVLLP